MRPVCIVTGAGGRLGGALCTELASDYDIVAVYRTTTPAPSTAYGVQADLGKASDVRRLVEVALAQYGRVDAVVNSAADTKFHGNLLDLRFAPESAVLSQLDVNSVAPMLLASELFQTSWKNERAENESANRSIVNVSSVSGLYVGSNVGQAFYSASKAALNMLTMFLAGELAPYAVRVNALCPSRFHEPAATARVVGAVKSLLAGSDTGLIQDL